MDGLSGNLTLWQKSSKFLRRNFWSLFFPLAASTAILLDLSKTRRFKANQALLAKQAEIKGQN